MFQDFTNAIIVVVVGCILLAIFVVFLPEIIRWIFAPVKPNPQMKLIDEIPFKATRLTWEERAERMRGYFIEIGRDKDSGETFVQGESDRNKSMVILGKIRSGKTTGVKEIILRADIRRHGNSVIIFDSKGDIINWVSVYCRRCRRELFVYPDIGFNVLNLGNDPILNAELFINVFMQIKQMGANTDYWFGIQSRFVMAILPLFQAVYKKPMILEELRLLCSDKALRNQIVEKAKAMIAINQEDEDSLYHLKNTLARWKTEFAAREIAELDTALGGLKNFINDICSGKGSAELYNKRYAPNLEELINRRCIVVIREGGSRNTKERIRGLLFMASLQAQAVRINREVPEDERHFISLVMDEFQNYLNPLYPAFITQSASAGFSHQLAFQNLDQLIDTSMSPPMDFREFILGNAWTKILYTGLTAKDAEYFQEQISKRYYETTSVGEDQSKRQGEKHTTRTQLDYQYPIPASRIIHMDPQTIMVFAPRGFGMDPPRFIEKPKPEEGEYPSIQNKVAAKDYPPPTTWEEEQAQKERNSPNNPPISNMPSPVEQNKILNDMQARANGSSSTNGNTPPEANTPKPKANKNMNTNNPPTVQINGDANTEGDTPQESNPKKRRHRNTRANKRKRQEEQA